MLLAAGECSGPDLQITAVLMESLSHRLHSLYQRVYLPHATEIKTLVLFDAIAKVSSTRVG